jgi:hypothetical protein
MWHFCKSSRPKFCPGWPLMRELGSSLERQMPAFIFAFYSLVVYIGPVIARLAVSPAVSWFGAVRMRIFTSLGRLEQ